jgi:tRNA U34 5-carboxymethylaminomethyl modifying GTPase MnmE/TrmE
MSLFVKAARFSPFVKQGSLQFNRRMSTGPNIKSLLDLSGPWDTNNRIRVASAIGGLAIILGVLFDAAYRRVNKQELNQAMDKLDAKIDKKIDGLTNALLQTNQHVDAKINTEMGKLDAKINMEMGKLDSKIEKLDAKINAEMGKLDIKIDGLTSALLQTNQHVDAKIDGLTNALLHTNQRDKIAAETENRELKREIERFKEERRDNLGTVLPLRTHLFDRE